MNPRVSQGLRLSRVLFLVGISLTVAGGALEGSDTTSDVLIGLKLVKAGYSIVVVFAAILLAIQAYFWTQYSLFSRTSRLVRDATCTLSSLALTTDFRFSKLWLLVPHLSLCALPTCFYLSSTRPTSDGTPYSARLPRFWSWGC